MEMCYENTFLSCNIKCPLKYIPVGNFRLKKNMVSQEVNSGGIYFPQWTQSRNFGYVLGIERLPLCHL